MPVQAHCLLRQVAFCCMSCRPAAFSRKRMMPSQVHASFRRLALSPQSMNISCVQEVLLLKACTTHLHPSLDSHLGP